MILELKINRGYFIEKHKWFDFVNDVFNIKNEAIRKNLKNNGLYVIRDNLSKSDIDYLYINIEIYNCVMISTHLKTLNESILIPSILKIVRHKIINNILN